MLLASILWFGFVVGVTASNSVPLSRAGRSSQAITPDSLKPADCAGIVVTTIIYDGNGLTDNDLMLGTPGADSMNGNNGDDCLLGGDGNDVLRGGGGTNDICIGGPGSDTFVGCETQIQ